MPTTVSANCCVCVEAATAAVDGERIIVTVADREFPGDDALAPAPQPARASAVPKVIPRPLTPAPVATSQNLSEGRILEPLTIAVLLTVGEYRGNRRQKDIVDI